MVRAVVAREAFYTPVIRSQTFLEPVPLNCELHKYFSVFLSPPSGGEDG